MDLLISLKAYKYSSLYKLPSNCSLYVSVYVYIRAYVMKQSQFAMTIKPRAAGT